MLHRNTSVESSDRLRITAFREITKSKMRVVHCRIKEAISQVLRARPHLADSVASVKDIGKFIVFIVHTSIMQVARRARTQISLLAARVRPVGMLHARPSAVEATIQTYDT